MEKCRMEDCEKPVKVKSQRLCGTHYARWWKHGDPTVSNRRQRPGCSVEGCNREHRVHGFCGLHYGRMQRYGSTELPERPTVCAVEGCGRDVQAWALCDRHYRRARVGKEKRYCRFCGKSLDPNAQPWAFCSPECRAKALAAKRRETHRERWLKHYGLTPESFDAMLESQGRRCAICRTDEPGYKGWCVDHDHATEAVRGILCSDCNLALGYAHDNPTVLEAAIRYLKA